MVGIQHPRRLAEHQIFQLLVFLQTTHQRSLVTCFLLPELEGGLCFRILGKDMFADAVSIVRGSLRDGIIGRRLTHCRQSLDHQPRRIVRIFEGQFLILTVSRQEGSQVDGLLAWLNLCKRHGDSDTLCTRQYRQIMLLAIREAFAHSHHLTDERCHVGTQFRERKRGTARSTLLQRKVLSTFEYHSLGLRIQQSQTGLAADSMIARIEDTGREHGLIAFADEARHIGLYHHILLCHSLTFEQTVAHIRCMSESHKAPGGQTLRQRKLQGDNPRGVCRQLGIEEGRLVEVLADLYLIQR